MSGPEDPTTPLPPTEPIHPAAPVAPTAPTDRLDPRAVPPRRPLAAPVPERRVVEHVPAAPVAEEPWWGSPGPAIVAGLVGLVLGGVLGYAIGDKHEASPASTGVAGAHTVTRTVTTVRPQVVVRTNTVTDKTVTQTPAPAAPASEEPSPQTEATIKRLERENEELKRHAEEG